MNLFSDFEQRIRATVTQIIGADVVQASPEMLDRINAEPPRDPAHGDIATNAAMVLAKPLGLKPRELAMRIAARIEADPDVVSVQVAGPGFVNLRLADGFWAAHLTSILRTGPAYGHSDLGGGASVNVEYVSANPTGPMHVGHCRGAVVGDAIANLLAATGHRVTREYYINDAGAQVDTLARSAYLRYREALGEEIGEIPSGFYPGDYLRPVGEALKVAFGDSLLVRPEDEWLPVVREHAIDAMMAMIRSDLELLGIRHDVFFSERSLKTGQDRVAEATAALDAKGLIYQGTLPPPKGQPPEGWEDREQTLFRATEFGDDIDRPLMKSDGSYTYFASDIAYHYDKILRGFRKMIDVLGADHGGYEKRMKAAVLAMSDRQAELEVQLCQLVKLYRAGEPVQMSKRSGDFVTLRDVVEEVGRDSVRFMMLFRKADAPLDFDFQKVTEQSKDNPVFYVQYAHARTASVRRQAGEEAPGIDLGPESLAEADLSRLSDPGERALLRGMADWPRIVDAAAREREPHRVAFYLYDLASAFHAHWSKGKDLPQLRFMRSDDIELSRARLALVTALGTVLKSGLQVLGVEAPDEMY
jgi:arginyl-tRNA synthetase